MPTIITHGASALLIGKMFQREMNTKLFIYFQRKRHRNIKTNFKTGFHGTQYGAFNLV